MNEAAPVLVIGYGNPGRLDDGLGPALVEALELRRVPGVTTDADYQLSVEHAALIAQHGVVVFADAAVDGPEPFDFHPVVEKPGLSFTSHSLRPGELMALARELFGADAKGHLLAIRGYEFDRFGEGLSGRAQTNLDSAVEFLAERLQREDFRQTTTENTPPAAEKAACGQGD